MEKKAKLDFKEGEFVLVCGVSGSGKTTLLRGLKDEYGLRAGYVAQNVEDNIVTDKVWHELAFGLENLGFEQEYIRRKTAEMTSFFGLSEVYRKRTDELSGGMKQLVLLASVMATEPEILLLDEPTAQLDPISAEKLLTAVEKIHRELGTTVIIAEHRFSELLGVADRIAVCENNALSYFGGNEEVCERLYAENNRLFASLPAYVRMYFELGGREFFGASMPLSVAGGRRLIREKADKTGEWYEKQLINCPVSEKSEVSVSLKNISLSYGKNEVLKNLDFEAEKGKLSALLGGNGAGKSTVLGIIAGINDDYSGKVKIADDSRIALLAQNPRQMFLKEKIGEELEFYNKMCGNRRSRAEIEEICKICGIEDILDRHPYDVSGGEIQRAAIARSLMGEPDILLLDEPTKGMETAFRNEFGDFLRGLCDKGITVIMASHDLDFALLYADDCALLFDGEISVKAGAAEFFEGNTFYTGELMKLFGSRNGGRTGRNEKNRNSGSEDKDSSGGSGSRYNGRDIRGKNTDLGRYRLPMLITFLCVFVAMPLTVFFGSVYLDNRKYFFISLLVMVELMLPAYLFYEAKKPRAIEIVVLATLTALTVTGRVVFYMLPVIKPVIALVMLAGLAFGPLSGMMVGASSMLISNIFFRQGPWTPWQMFTFAIIGLLSGLLGRNEKNKNNLPLICVTGVFMTLVVFGGIMNPASVIMYEPDFNRNMIFTAYATGFPYDLLSAAFTAVFLWIGTKPMLKKCERVKRYMS